MSRLLDHHGLLNGSVDPFENLSKRQKKVKAVYCLSYDCTMNVRGRKGRLIHLGHVKLERCPFCDKRDYLNYSTCSLTEVEREET
jgi:hypothetical protein